MTITSMSSPKEPLFLTKSPLPDKLFRTLLNTSKTKTQPIKIANKLNSTNKIQTSKLLATEANLKT